MSGWVKNTGGFVEFPRDNYRYSESLSAMDGFEDSVSRIIAACLHASDTKDTDLDGLTDCDELYGMLTAGFNVICTNPRKSDTDGDGLSDMDELGSEAVLPADVKNAFLNLKNLMPDRFWQTGFHRGFCRSLRFAAGCRVCPVQ